MAGGIAFDWRGTPIKEGKKVVAHALGKTPNRYIGVVSRVNSRTVSVRILERDSSWSRAEVVTLGHASVLVLTPDLFEAPASE